MSTYYTKYLAVANGTYDVTSFPADGYVTFSALVGDSFIADENFVPIDKESITSGGVGAYLLEEGKTVTLPFRGGSALWLASAEASGSSLLTFGYAEP